MYTVAIRWQPGLSLAAKTAELGGNVLVPPTDIPGVGRFCAIVDPGGAAVSLITMPAGAQGDC